MNMSKSLEKTRRIRRIRTLIMKLKNKRMNRN